MLPTPSVSPTREPGDFLVFQKPVTTVLITDVAYAYNHPPLKAFSPSEVGYKHNERANVLFYDGHVAPHSIRQTNNLNLAF